MIEKVVKSSAQIICVSSFNLLSLFLLSAATLLMTVGPAEAYIGPGVGAGAIIAVFATIIGLVLLFVGVLWFPIRRKLRARREKNREIDPESAK
ncbi:MULTISPECIES: hypothetical protein [unclassified Ruegeria]|uniref:hypothetical protein n=1 Tax=unclassified Ruegeria TaxID=2625375 RepID=UPI0020C4EA2E|nr:MULTISPECIES: hypothetical protein [unclassified Ruegeria]